jgi:antitoxin ParD1/3/4
MDLPLTPELEAFIASRVASGQYDTPVDVISAGLRLLKERDHDREAGLEDLRASIREGIDQADRGELIPGDVVRQEIEALSRERRRLDR